MKDPESRKKKNGPPADKINLQLVLDMYYFKTQPLVGKVEGSIMMDKGINHFLLGMVNQVWERQSIMEICYVLNLNMFEI